MRGAKKKGREAIQCYFKLHPRNIPRPICLTQIASSLYVASLGQLGRAAEAQEVLHTLQSILPSSFQMYVRQRPSQYCSAEYAPMLQGLCKAGWKEWLPAHRTGNSILSSRTHQLRTHFRKRSDPVQRAA